MNDKFKQMSKEELKEYLVFCVNLSVLNCPRKMKSFKRNFTSKVCRYSILIFNSIKNKINLKVIEYKKEEEHVFENGYYHKLL